MKDLIPLPRPVELALPPRATVSADKAALLPPKPERVYVSVCCVYADTTMCLLPLCPITKVAGISLVHDMREKNKPMIKLIWGPKWKVRYLWHINWCISMYSIIPYSATPYA